MGNNNSTTVSSSIEEMIEATKKKPKKILVPLPTIGYDPTETCVAVTLLKKNMGHTIIFATPDGKMSEGCDPHVLQGFVKGLLLKTKPEVVEYYTDMITWEEYLNPISYDNIVPNNYDALVLVGGHHPGMKTFLASKILHDKISEFYSLSTTTSATTKPKPIAAICHGTLCLSRAATITTKEDDGKGKPLLHGRKFTTLPKWLEYQGYLISNYLSGGLLPGKEYQLSTTWPVFVEDEIRQSITMDNSDNDNNISTTELLIGPYDVLSPLLPGNSTNPSRNAFVVVDDDNDNATAGGTGAGAGAGGRLPPLVTARFWSDSYLWTMKFGEILEKY